MGSNAAEVTEQPVREQLRKTTIAASTTSSAKHTTPPEVRKKRSFEDLQASEELDTAAEVQPKHTRKRSRDSTAEDEDARAEFKRSSHEIQRDIVNQDIKANGAAADRPHTPEQQPPADVTTSDDAMISPKVKRSRLQNGSVEPADVKDTKDPPSSATDVKQGQQTSASAFAASGFSALSSSTSSGFGALGKSTSGGFGGLKGFGSPAKTPDTGLSAFAAAKVDKPDDKPQSSETSSSTFGGALGARSAFSGTSTTSGFGSSFAKTSAFGSASGFGSLASTAPLTSFASKTGTPAPLAQKPARPFGAPAEDNEEEAEDGPGDDEADDSGIKSPISVGTEEDKKDSRFFEQKLETGEEGEQVVYQSRAKLYNFALNAADKKEWKERGSGVLKLNVSKAEGDDGDAAQHLTARLLIRADGSHRIVLNSPILKSIKVGNPAGGPPNNGQLSFMGTIDGKTQLELLQLKMKAPSAIELYEKILEIQEQMV